MSTIPTSVNLLDSVMWPGTFQSNSYRAIKNNKLFSNVNDLKSVSEVEGRYLFSSDQKL